MSSKNEKHFYRRLNVQVCELLQVLTEAAIKSCFGKQVFLKFYSSINSNLNLAKNLENMCEEVLFSKVAGLQAYSQQLQ